MKKLFCVCLIIVSCFSFSFVFASNTFYDTRGTKYEGVVERMAKLEIINGMTDTTYAPNKSVTRAELAKIITKMRGMEDYADDVVYKNVFSDVKKTDWFFPYVTVATDLGLINGYEDGTFKPNKEVTYAELVVILLRNLGYTRISEDSPNGWYWNYIVKMREIELNDNIGEFNYTTPAKRGDVAMFVWNALITDRWAIVSENENDGFTYTYAEQTPLEMYFEGYKFLDNEKVSEVIGENNKTSIVVKEKSYSTNEKVPLYVLGGNVTALYKIDDEDLIGVTFDEDYPDENIVSGPIFYLRENGYNPSRARNIASYGSRDKATFAYLIMNKDKSDIIRTVYLDASNSIIVDKISVTEESGDKEKIQEIHLNDEELSSVDVALVKNGFNISFKDLKKDNIVTNLGDGLYVLSNEKIEAEITDINNENEIWLDEDKYEITDDCDCYFYKEKSSQKYSTISSKKLNEYIGTKATAYLNIAEEVCRIEFRKTEKENNEYFIGYVTKIARYDDGEFSLEVSDGYNKSKRFKVNLGESSTIQKGNLVGVNEKADSKNKVTIIKRDYAFDNEIAVKYNYDAKEISYPMIGEYMVNDDTQYYKVTFDYENNSVNKIDNCKIEKIEVDDIEDLMIYKLNLIYNEDMEVISVYAINEKNKFENQIALVKDKKKKKIGDDKYSYKVTLSVIESYVQGYDVSESEYEKFRIGDVVTFSFKDSNNIIFNEAFKYEFIGYKRDLIIDDFDNKNKKIYFNDGSVMDLNEDIYDWNGNKINLNKYRFILAKVSKNGDNWGFHSLDVEDKEKLNIEKGDRIAIGELEGVIVIYRGYEE